MVLTPQHLQAQDRYAQDLLSFHLAHFHSRFYGYTALEVSQQTASSGTVFSVRRAAGILPDGTPFSVPEAGKLPEPIAVNQRLFRNVQKMAHLDLVLPPFREAGVNVSFNGSHPEARFTPDFVNVKDEGDPRFVAPIWLASKNFRLALHTELDPAKGTSQRPVEVRMPIARLRRSSEDLFEIDREFVPPVLDIHVSPVLTALLKDIVQRVAAKIHELGHLGAQKSTTLAEFHASDAPAFWLLHSLNSQFPALRHYVESKPNHPESVFLALSTLASTLTLYSQTIKSLDIPEYDHAEFGSCYAKIGGQLRELLNVVIPRRYVSIPFARTSPNLYTCDLKEEWLGSTEVYLSVQSRAASSRDQMSYEDLVSRVQLQAKIGAKNRAQSAGVYATTAIRLIFRDSLSIRHPFPKGPAYFQLDLSDSNSNAEWTEVRRVGGLDIRMPPEIPGPELELLVVLSNAKSKTLS